MKRPTILLTAFEAFGGESVNASERAVATVDPARIGSVTLVRAVLPCVFGQAIDVLLEAFEAHTPSVVVCTGQAGGRSAISLERIAINVDDARIPDNVGAQPVDRPIVKEGPTAYWSTLPIKAIVATLRAQGVPAEVSQSAGTFVCNHVFYGLMHALARRPQSRGGFVHVPLLPEQAARLPEGTPSLPADKLSFALEAAIRVTLETTSDIVLPGGSLH